jgi:beta-galactosidase
MRFFTFLPLLIALMLNPFQSFSQHSNLFADIENPLVVGRNKLQPTAFAIPYATADQAFENNWEASPWFKSLNGSWHFKFAERLSERPDDFFKSEYQPAGWDQVPVPSNWEILGYGVPIYVNIPYEWTTDPQPPSIPREENPSGSYITMFEIPDNWRDRKTIIHFER